MPDEAELLWRFYQEHCTWERHHEEMRTSATNVLLAIAAAVVALTTYDQTIDHGDLPLAVFLVLQGTYGALFTHKHYERFRMHKGRAGRYRAELDRLLPGAQVLALRRSSDDANAANFPLTGRLRLHWFWTGVHVLVGTVGVWLTIWALA